MRLRNNLPAFSETDRGSPHSTFTVPDGNGKLRAKMVAQDGRLNSVLANSCMFHIQVYSTRDELDCDFYMAAEHYKKAMDMTLAFRSENDRPAEQVFVLARLHSVYTNPGITLYADPWKLYLDGKLRLAPSAKFRASVTNVPAMVSQRSLSQGSAPDPEQIYARLPITPAQVRLLQLEFSGVDDDDETAPLHVRLVHKPLNESLKFWAISYVWGAAPTMHHPYWLVVNGVKVLITETLYTCLRALRRKRVSVLLWADAVCINQQDNTEKAHQARRMGQLYEWATRVIVWLGATMAEDVGGVEALRLITQQGNGTGQNGSGGLVTADHVDGIDALLQRPWFTRTWVVQELVFGSRVTVMSGNSEMEWAVFVQGILNCERQLRLLRPEDGAEVERFLGSSYPALALHRMRNVIKGLDGSPRQKFSLLELTDALYYTYATRPVDRLFALIHMAHDTPTDDECFAPDYISHERIVLARYARGVVLAGKALDLLYRAGASKGSSFCTWIPNLTDTSPHRGPPPHRRRRRAGRCRPRFFRHQRRHEDYYYSFAEVAFGV
jgi:hypothetical protein